MTSPKTTYALIKHYSNNRLTLMMTDVITGNTTTWQNMGYAERQLKTGPNSIVLYHKFVILSICLHAIGLVDLLSHTHTHTQATQM